MAAQSYSLPNAPPRERAAPRWARRRDLGLLLGPCLAYLIVLSVFPLLYSLWASFQNWDPRTRTFSFAGFDNYADLLSSATFWTATRNTAIFTLGDVALQVVLGTLLALFFHRKLRGASFVRALLLLPMLLTPVVVGLMWRMLLDSDWGVVPWGIDALGLGTVGWLTDPGIALITLILIDTWQWTPFVFFIVYARLQALPEDVFEAASVDGASAWQRTRLLTLPLLLPAIAFAGIFRGIDAFRTFDLVYGLTNGGPGDATRTLSFEAFQNGFSYQRYGYASAVSYVMVIVAVVGVTVLLRFVAVRREDG
jgi:multiple sugar transport system permease protein